MAVAAIHGAERLVLEMVTVTVVVIGVDDTVVMAVAVVAAVTRC